MAACYGPHMAGPDDGLLWLVGAHIIGEPPAGDGLTDATGTTLSLQYRRRARKCTGVAPWSARVRMRHPHASRDQGADRCVHGRARGAAGAIVDITHG
jgi:hypothetical protein